MQSQFLRRAQAAAYLKSTYGFGAAKTLAKLATVGGGPVYSLAGRFPIYTQSNLDKWALSRISAPASSTSEHRENLASRPRRTPKTGERKATLSPKAVAAP